MVYAQFLLLQAMMNGLSLESPGTLSQVRHAPGRAHQPEDAEPALGLDEGQQRAHMERQ